MTSESPDAGVEQLLGTPNLADALESEHFKQFLDKVPVAIAVSELKPAERLVYVNLEFENLTGLPASSLAKEGWTFLRGEATDDGERRNLGEMIAEDRDHIGAFELTCGDTQQVVDAWSNVIKNDGGAPVFRLVALVEKTGTGSEADSAETIAQKDTLLRELQHRVKNNLQMITALIRMESRNLQDKDTGERFARLAGRVEALALLYQSLSPDAVAESDTIDLGVYLSQVASAVMRAHAVEGIRLDLQVDTWPVSVNVAMPTGLVVNELLTNALKHAFKGREGGTITLHSLVQDGECRVVVADDGIGFQDSTTWPAQGKLGTLIARSLRQNAKAQIDVEGAPGQGVRVTITFRSEDAA